MQHQIMFDAQTIGASALMMLAATGVVVPEMPHDIIMIGAAFIGSMQAASARAYNGSLKGLKHTIWAFIAGLTAGLLVGRAVAEMMSLTTNTSELLPVYLFSLFGGKMVLWFTTGFDVEKIGNWLVSKITRK